MFRYFLPNQHSGTKITVIHITFTSPVLLVLPIRCVHNYSTQDRSPFCNFHILNEISQHLEFMDLFLVRKHYHIFLVRLSNQMQSTQDKGVFLNTICTF